MRWERKYSISDITSKKDMERYGTNWLVGSDCSKIGLRHSLCSTSLCSAIEEQKRSFNIGLQPSSLSQTNVIMIRKPRFRIKSEVPLQWHDYSNISLKKSDRPRWLVFNKFNKPKSQKELDIDRKLMKYNISLAQKRSVGIVLTSIHCCSCCLIHSWKSMICNGVWMRKREWANASEFLWATVWS